jgi:type IV pilus assembly protein PilA
MEKEKRTMKNIKFRWLKNEKGLTLIELLAVVVVLGIVAAIAVPSVGNAIENSKKRADKATLELIKEAAINYVVVEDLDNLPDKESVSTLISKGFLTKTPKMQSKNLEFKTFSVSEETDGAYTVKVFSDDNGTAEIKDSDFN